MCNNAYHPVFCAIPPYMLEKIIEAGTHKQKEKAKKTIALAGQMRGQRQSVADITLKSKALGGGKIRRVYNAQNQNVLPGILVRSEGDAASGDKHVDEAYDGAGATYDLYHQVFERDSIDNSGMEIISTVRYLKGYDNAFWNGTQMVYGEGDEDLPETDRIFNRFTVALDIIGHELTHGVTQYEANLVYQDQPGALNESFSDVFGSLVKQRVKNQTAADADWIIGEGLFTANVNGKGIRSMKSPGTAYNDRLIGKDPQPGHMNDFVVTTRDRGGVHINSGIPNRAFYLAAIEIGGYAWEKTGKIWYVALRDKLKTNSNFEDAANLTYLVAGELYGENSTEQNAVKKAWDGVGMPIKLEERKGCGTRLFGK